jgi:hypothetical protein
MTVPRFHQTWCDLHLHAIADAAHALNALRVAWLDPPDAAPAVLKTRTLTALYNQRPAWLAQSHSAPDRAVWAA